MTQKAVTLLGIDRPDGGHVNYASLLQEHLAADPKQLTTLALALVAATAEEITRQSPSSTVVVRYLDAIERLGYQPPDWEQAKRLTNAAA